MTDKNRILIVEDDDDVRNTLAMRLQLEGFEVVSASRGKEGWQKVHTTEPDLMILDLKLPDMPGEEICRELRENEYSKLPIIMLTAKDRDVDEVIGCVLGANEYVCKPFDMEKLMEKVKSLLK